MSVTAIVSTVRSSRGMAEDRRTACRHRGYARRPRPPKMTLASSVRLVRMCAESKESKRGYRDADRDRPHPHGPQPMYPLLEFHCGGCHSSMDEQRRTLSVILVDDDEDLVKGLAAGLVREGFEATWTTDPSVAMEEVATKHFDVAVLDLVMPRMWGLNQCQALTNLAPGLRCIILTGHGSVEHCRKSFHAGSVDFLTKPVSIVKLSECIISARSSGGQFTAFIDSLKRYGIMPRGARVDDEVVNLLLEPLQHDIEEFKSRTLRLYLQRALECSNDNPKRMAEMTGCSLATVYRLLGKHRLGRPESD